MSQDANKMTQKTAGPSLPMMRAFALGLLFLMSGLYILSIAMQGDGAWWGYLRAFSEAAMVGGLADWFAVTAIFRRPFGLPIPHTAVIQRNKDRIADALGDFVAVNFLSPEIVRERVEDQKLSRAVAEHAAEPETARRVADGIVDAIPALIDLMDDEAVSGFMRKQAEAYSRDADLGELVGNLLTLVTEHGHHQIILDAFLAEAWRALEENEATIRQQVRSRTFWAWRLVSLDKQAANAMIGSVEDVLEAMARDPEHPGRQRITDAIQKFADDIGTSPELRAQIQSGIVDVLEHPSVLAFFRSLWGTLKQTVQTTASDRNAAVRQDLSRAIERFGAALNAETETQEALDRRLRALLVDLADRHGQDIGHLISETIHSWDTKTVVTKLEQSVGPDLQYIRINGTLIGGLIGLSIHQLTILFAH
ncbi:DUF445 domain-containing protein [Henriciella aquimarina]|uniref:DUF445 domain-containing protein n=1 Tax=Henriciella aquimarina TaxID=545261 RepID=UPI00117AA49B|nr:DUF445 domain-containing protein [Henriciella aquimarina]